jgi:hypothetical protein
MNAKHFDAWTRHRFGLAAGNSAALLGLRHNQVWGEPARCEATHQRCHADALDYVAGAHLIPDMRPSPCTPWKKPLMSHRLVRVPALALLAVLLVAGPAFSKVLVGDDGPNILIGTKRADQINGKGDPDVLKGKAGNDTYIFEDGWGQDTALIEGRRGGKDTLDFSAVTTFVGVVILREFDQFDIFSEHNDRIGLDADAGIPYIETVIGGKGEGDALVTGGGPNTLNPGGGGTDILEDHGGWNEGPGSDFMIPASNDTYVGFNPSSNSGTDTIRDWGGTDVVDLRPMSSSSVTMTAIDADGSNGTEESLEIAWNLDPNIKVVIDGHFEPYDPFSSTSGMNGHIEKLIFADVTYTDKNPPTVEGLVSPESTRGKRTEMPASEMLTAEGNGDETVEVEADFAPDTHQDRANKGKKSRKAMHARR